MPMTSNNITFSHISIKIYSYSYYYFIAAASVSVSIYLFIYQPPLSLPLSVFNSTGCSTNELGLSRAALYGKCY